MHVAMCCVYEQVSSAASYDLRPSYLPDYLIYSYRYILYCYTTKSIVPVTVGIHTRFVIIKIRRYLPITYPLGGTHSRAFHSRRLVITTVHYTAL